MQYGSEAGRLDDLVEGVLAGDVGDDGDGQTAGRQVFVDVADLLGLILGADGRDDVVAALEELLENVGGDKAGAAWLRAFSVRSSM